MGQNQSLNLRMMVFTSLFTALMIIGGYLMIPIPFSPIPIALSDLFVMLAGLCLGTSGGVASVCLFLFLGTLGLPVFAGGKAGLAVLMGPTGGYLLGYLMAVAIIGLITGKGKPSPFRDLVALIAGNIIIFGTGIPGLKLICKVTWEKAFALGLIPFIPGNILKIIVAFALIRTLRPFLKQSITNPASDAGD